MIFDIRPFVIRAISFLLAIPVFNSAATSTAQILNEEELPVNAAELEARFITNSVTLTSSGRRAGEGYFSPDGKFMVFQSERVIGNPFYQIFRMDMETGESIQISPGHGKTTCAWIHPVTGDVLFASTHGDQLAREKQVAEIAERESSTIRRYGWDYDEHYELYRWTAQNGEIIQLTDSLGYDAEGSYSPDGEWICFASNREAYDRELSKEEQAKLQESPEYFMNLYLMRADGSDIRKLTDRVGYDGGPFFSPDGSRICWRSFDESGVTAEIWTMNIDGSDKKQLTRMLSTSWAPYYHPSGRYLIFTTNRHGFKNFELYIVDAEGLVEPRRVTYTPGFDGLPVFTPDGQQIVWTSERNATVGQAMNAERKLGPQIEIADWNHEAALQALGIKSQPTSSTTQDDIEQDSLAVAKTSAGLTNPDYDADDVLRHVMYLCDPELRGRMTGSLGERKATAYVAAYMDALGLLPAGDQGTWFQRFEYPAGAELGSGNRMSAGDGDLALDQDWRPIAFSQAGDFGSAEVVFAGYGIVAEKDDKNPGYDSFVHLDVKDKWVIVLRHLPEDVSDELRQFLAIHANLARKAMELRDRGAKGMFVVSGPNSHFTEKLIPLKNDFARGKTSLGAVSISDEVAAEWLKLAGKDLVKLQSQLDRGEQIMGFKIPGLKVTVNVDIRQNRGIGRNAIGRLQWRDKPSEQIIVVGAHVDHLGDGRSSSSLANAEDKILIHYGADDNASGVAAMLEIAEYLAHRKRTGNFEGMERDIVFAAWSGEELGLHGSNHFVKMLQWALLEQVHGKFDDGTTPDILDDLDSKIPLPKLNAWVIAYLNMDMVGRYRDQLQLQGLGSSEDWGGLIETANFATRFKITKVLDTNLPTDATGFYRAGTPILAAFTGSHSDYHTPRDTPDKLNYPDIAKVAKFVGNLAVALSKHERGPTYQRYDKTESRGTGGVMGVVYLGTHPDYAFEGTGVRITGVTENSPSHQAGLTEGDVILSLGGRQIENLNEYMFTIGALKIGRETSVVILRNGERVTLSIVPGIKE